MAGGEHPGIAHEKTVDVLRLIRSENVGPVTFFKLLSYFGSVGKALERIPEMSVKGGRAKPIRIASEAEAKREMDGAEALGAKFIHYGSPDYPALLQRIHDAPPVLTVLGHPSVWKREFVVGIVGARNASANGCRFANILAQQLGKQDVCVASGLARGIDAACHIGALATGTVGVIAGGIDTVYPPENKDLYAKMAETGAIITEQPFGFAPQPRSFPARNRIISGMSRGIVVVEASLKSGSLITAHMAIDQNREVFAVPGSPLDPRCHGTNHLLREGAILTESAEDILAHLRFGQETLFSDSGLAGYTPPVTQPPSEKELEKARHTVAQKMGATPVLVDELIVQCQLTANVVLTALLEMELAGRIHRHPGNRVSLSL